jgi:cell division septal protein FtsQ
MRLPAISIGSLIPIGSWRTRALLAFAAAGALAIGYFGWLRDSPLVAVREVKVAGVTSADRDRIVAALTDAARGMTTFHVDTDRLEAAARSFPTVASVQADPRFPHGMTIHVTERRAALIAVNGERQVPVAADGTLLPTLRVDGENLPRLAVAELPATGRLSGDALDEAIAIGAAPAQLRPLIEDASVSPDYGVVLAMRGGIELRFGETRGMGAKWAAVAAILADRALTGLAYVDARVPDRPAVG